MLKIRQLVLIEIPSREKEIRRLERHGAMK